MATGYTKGDPSKLDKSGGTMTGPLVLSGAPTQALHAATKAYVDAAPGGGGGAGVPAITVVSETAFGQAAAVGTGTMQAREDHTHGTPAAPTAASVGADPTGTAAGQVAAHVAAADPHGDRAYTDSRVTGFRGAWSGATAYNAGDIVTLAAANPGGGLRSGASYGALAGNTNKRPVVSTQQPAPTTADAADASGYEIGVRFTVSRVLPLTGIVLHKAVAATGLHTAHLWNADTGTLLASAPIDAETGSGPQLCSLQYDCRPGVNYEATVSLPVGHYGTTTGAFAVPLANGSVTFTGGRFNTTLNTLPNAGTTTYYGVTPVWDEPDAAWSILGRY